MQALVIKLPGLIGLLLPALLRLTGGQLRLPNRDYWLAPARYASTLSFLTKGLRRLAVWQLILLACVHALIVEANRLHPPQLAKGRFVFSLLFFFAGLLAWLVVLWHFCRRPPA